MHKLFINATAAGLVLFSGLASCSKEKTHTDVYSTTPPLILTGSGSHDLKAWDALKQKELDAQDSFDFADSRPARGEVKSHCRQGRENFYGRKPFRGLTRIQVWQVLPTELLTLKLMPGVFECSFELNLFNTAGSQRIYNVAQVPVVDGREWPAQFLFASGDALPDPLLAREFANVRIRYQNVSTADAKILCHDFETPQIAFARVMDLSHFEFKMEALEAHPRQNCRVQIFENGSPVAMSRLTNLQFSPPPLEVVPLDVPHSFSSAQFIQNMRNMFARVPMTIAKWKIRNPGKVARGLRLPKGEFPGSIRAFQRFTANFSEAMGDWQQMEWTLRATKLIVEGPPAVTVQDAATMTIKIEPAQAVTIAAVFQSHLTSNCLDPDVPPVNLVSFFGYTPIAVDELASDGVQINSHALQINPYVAGFDGPPAGMAIKNAVRCEWN